MPARPSRSAVAAALSVLLLLTACGGSEELPDVEIPQAQQEFDGESVVGFMADANAEEVTLQLPDGSFRSFAVRSEDRERVGIEHLASHVGFTDIGFEVFYEDEGDTDYVVAAQEVAPPRVTATASPGAGEPPGAVTDTTIELTVVGGEVSGDTGRVEVAAGEPVSLTVTADVADEVHVHGYDLLVDTVPGQPAQLSFVADTPGVFEIELEGAGTLLTRLQVQ